MKILIALNFIVGLLLAANFTASAKIPDEDNKAVLSLLLGMCLLGFFLVLAAVNFIFIFKQWRKIRFMALVPFGTYVAAFILSFFVTKCGMDIILKGTPCRPDSFFSEPTKVALTLIADELIAEHREEKFTPKINAKLKKYDLKPLFIDTNNEIVLLGCYHSRHWFEYLYSKNGSTNLPSVNTGYAQPVAKALGDNWYFRDW